MRDTPDACDRCGVPAGLHWTADGGLWWDAVASCWRGRMALPDLTRVPIGLECVTIRQANLWDFVCQNCERSVKR
jgi:hypothetical protein